MIKLILGLSLCIFSLGTYFIWLSKKNIFNHLNIGFIITAYLIPVFVIDYNDYIDAETLNLYVWVNLVGAFAYVLGLMFGVKIKNISIIDHVLLLDKFDSLPDTSLMKIVRFFNSLYIIAITGTAVSFILMGFVPMFAEDIVSAKFFKGPYQESYHRVAFLYRTSRTLLEITIPIKFLILLYSPRFKEIVITVIGLLLISVSLTRGPVFNGFLLALSIFFSLKNSHWQFYLYIFSLIILIAFGSSIFYFAYIYFGVEGFYKADSILEAIAKGSPDISDQLNFLKNFNLQGSNFTLGKTFLGGLIPFNFYWNPSAWSLYILNDTNDISEIGSGGLRLPVSLWGFTSFGWIGVFLIPFSSGLFQGYIIKKIKKLLFGLTHNLHDSLFFFIIVFIFQNIGSIFINFYLISIYQIPAFLILFFIRFKYLKPSFKLIR